MEKLTNKIASHFKHLTIGEMIVSAEILYDSNGNNEIDKLLKNDSVKNPFYINNQKTDLSLLPLVFRFKLSVSVRYLM